jgi:IS5 family transposase
LEKALAILKQRQAVAKGKPPNDVSVVDPEAPWVKKAGRVVRGYSGQVAADSEHKIIVGVKATAEPVDFEQLNPMLEEVEKTTGQAADRLVADSGYYTDDAVLEASQSKTDCFVPDSETANQLNNPNRSEKEESAYQVSRFGYDAEKDEFTCPQGKKLPFVRNRQKRGHTKKIYRCADCHTCPFRAQCTEDARGFRSIELRVDHAQVRRLREKVKTENGKAIYKKRKAIIEPIFGRWQHNWGIRRLRLRGLAGFSIELHLLAIAHNLTKLFRYQQGFAQAVVMAHL